MDPYHGSRCYSASADPDPDPDPDPDLRNDVQLRGSRVPCHYVVVRRDLPLGVLGAQLVHAAGESSPGDLSEGTHAVVLMVPDEASLRALADRLERAGVALVRVVEVDAPYSGQLMAIGLRPVMDRSEVRRHTSMLPLLR